SDGKFMTLGALEPKFWANFCNRVGREDLIARQFDAGESRRELFEEVRAIFKSKTQSEWVELMRDADCCAEPALSMAEAFEHEQTRAREMISELDLSNEESLKQENLKQENLKQENLKQENLKQESLKQLGFAYKMSDTPPRMKHAAPALGEHTAELLASLGLSDRECEQLSNEGIIVIRK